MIRTKAAVLHGMHQPWEIMELDVVPPKAGEVLVRYVASGLCHSDYHVVLGDWGDFIRFPYVSGHEGAGVVEEVGPGVTDIKVGDHVVCSFISACGHCRWCASGRSNLCDSGAGALEGRYPDGGFRLVKDGVEYGSSMMLGTFSQWGTVSRNSIVKVNDWLPLESLVLLGCGVPTGFGSAVTSGGVKQGDNVVIYGAGGVGMNAVQGAAIAGALRVVVVDPVEFKREAALRFGATHVFATAEEAHEFIFDASWGVGADVSIVTVSTVSEKIVTDAINVLSKGGTTVLTAVAHPELKTINFPGLLLTQFERTIKGALFGSGNPHYEIPRLMRMYEEGKLKLDELVTARYRLEDINQGYQDMVDGKNLRGIIVHEH